MLTIERGARRREQSLLSMPDETPELFFGCDGAKLEPEDRARVTTPLCNRFCSRGTVGCAYSHVMLWRHIGALSEEAVVVLEDDTHVLPELHDLWPEIVRVCEEDHTVVQLAGQGLWRQRTRELGAGRTLVGYRSHYTTGAYALTPRLARELADHYEAEGIDYHIDYSLYGWLRTQGRPPWLCEPALAAETPGQPSTLATHESMARRYLPSKFFYALTFPIAALNGLVVSVGLLLLLALVLLQLLVPSLPLFPFCVGYLLMDFIVLE